MAGIGAILGVVSSVASAALGIAGARSQAAIMKAQANAEAQQLGMQGAEEKAVASRNAREKQKEGSLLLSRQKAVASASGGGATDPTVLELAGDLKRETNVQSRELMRQGLEKDRMLVYQGKIGRKMAGAQAKMVMAQGIGNAISSIGGAIGGLSDAFSKYGRGMPTSSGLATKDERDAPAWYYSSYS